MAQRVYAIPADYEDWAEELFDGDEKKLEKRLRAASVEVDKLTRLAVYDTDPDGYPADTDASEAFTEATCAIVEYWEETDDPTGADAAQGAISIGSVSLGTTSSRVSAGGQLEQRIGTRAVDILRNASLITSAVSY